MNQKNSSLVALVVAVVCLMGSNAWAIKLQETTKPVTLDYDQHILDYYDQLLRDAGWEIVDEDQIPECMEVNGSRCG